MCIAARSSLLRRCVLCVGLSVLCVGLCALCVGVWCVVTSACAVCLCVFVQFCIGAWCVVAVLCAVCVVLCALRVACTVCGVCPCVVCEVSYQSEECQHIDRVACVRRAIPRTHPRQDFLSPRCTPSAPPPTHPARHHYLLNAQGSGRRRGAGANWRDTLHGMHAPAKGCADIMWNVDRKGNSAPWRRRHTSHSTAHSTQHTVPRICPELHAH